MADPALWGAMWRAGWQSWAGASESPCAARMMHFSCVPMVSSVRSSRSPAIFATTLRYARPWPVQMRLSIASVFSCGGCEQFRCRSGRGRGPHRAHCGGIGRGPSCSYLGHRRRSGFDSDYARSKGKGEAAVLQAFPAAVILRPSVIFGNEDQFFNRFASMARFGPVLPVVGARPDSSRSMSMMSPRPRSRARWARLRLAFTNLAGRRSTAFVG